jgi:flagellar hook-associated protein 1 FlgK
VSTFSGLNTATTALWAQRRAIDVTGQNIANVNTEGYSRQRADLRAIGGSTVPAFYSTSDGIGGGVQADSVLRIRDAFLEGRGHTERANSARLVAESDALGLVEQAFREPGETGIQSLLSDMWNGWDDLSIHPTDPGARGQVLQRLDTLVDGVAFSHTQLGSQWRQQRESLTVLVADVNAAATSIAELNLAIQRVTQSGGTANDLVDQRDLLVMKVAEQVGAIVRPAKDGMLDVVVGGMSLVAGASANALQVAGALGPDGVSPPPPAVADPVRLVTAAGGYPVPTGGTARGQLTAMNEVIPAYRARLDQLAVKLAGDLNGVHDAALNPNSYDRTGVPGTAILGFSGTPGAATLRVLITDSDRLAASSLPPVGVPPAPVVPSADGSNADRIAELRQGSTSVDAGYRQLIVELGVQAAVTERSLGIQEVITTQVDASRESVAGVNIDEEMTNMLQYQHAYSAAGRLVTAIDQMLDTLINRTGVVGR